MFPFRRFHCLCFENWVIKRTARSIKAEYNRFNRSNKKYNIIKRNGKIRKIELRTLKKRNLIHSLKRIHHSTLSDYAIGSTVFSHSSSCLAFWRISCFTYEMGSSHPKSESFFSHRFSNQIFSLLRHNSDLSERCKSIIVNRR